jgi:histone H3/H4
LDPLILSDRYYTSIAFGGGSQYRYNRPGAHRGIQLAGSLSDTIRGLIEASDALEKDAPPQSLLTKIIERGAFRPAEDEAVGFWFARFLSIRESLWAVIDEALEVFEQPEMSNHYDRDLRLFVIGYAAVCLLIRIDRVLLFEVAEHSIVQRKLNESFPEYRIPRKQFTKIFASFVDESHALAIRDAMRFAKKSRRDILLLGTDPDVGFIARQLDELEASLNLSKRRYFKRMWEFVSHKWRRRGVVTAKNLLASVAEGVGRVASEISESRNKRVSPEILGEIAAFLQPGDVIVTRHAKALTNLFLPGFWPHISLYIGTPTQRDALGIAADERRLQRWIDDICVLEARKDGVRLRPLSDTLSVDVFAVLRPGLEPDGIRRAIERAMKHEGKMYNFDFDFFSSDRIVCTEVVYRAYDGLGNISFPLQERAGRKTLSAEDVLDFSLQTGAFEPVAIFGVKGCRKAIEYGDAVRQALINSYDSTPD